MQFPTILLTTLAGITAALPATAASLPRDLKNTEVRIRLGLDDKDRFLVLDVFEEFNPPPREILPINGLGLEPDGLLAGVVACEAVDLNGNSIGDGFSLGIDLNVALFEIDSISCQVTTST